MSEQKLEKMSVDSVKVSSDTSYIHLIDSETNVNDVNQSETVNSKVNITTEVQDEIKEVANEMGFRVGNFERRPIEGLVAFHTNNL